MNKNNLIIFIKWTFYKSEVFFNFYNSQTLNIILLIVIIIHDTNNLNVIIKLLQTN